MQTTHWTKDQKRLLLALRADNVPFSEASERVSAIGPERTSYACERQMKTLRERPDLIPPPLADPADGAVLTDKKLGKMNWREVLDFASSVTQRHDKTRTSQTHATVKIASKSDNIAIAFSSDWHFGAMGVDYGALREHIEYLIETPDLYLVLCGDETDNSLMFARNVLARVQVITPEEQYQWLAALFTELTAKKKLLAACYGNHGEMREEKVLGWSPTGLLKGACTNYFDGFGELTIEFGDEKYTVLLSHQGKGYSQYSRVFPANKQAMMYDPLVDVSVSAHYHTPEYAHTYGHRIAEKGRRDLTWPQAPRVNLVTGTFNTEDSYSLRGFGKGRIGVPTVVFYANEHRFVALPTPEDAVLYMGKN